jgi:hypothetical protein
MIYFLFVPTEGGRAEMSALTEVVGDDAAARSAAGRLAYGGRAGYLFDGDRFIGEVVTANSLLQPQAAPVDAASGPSPRPGLRTTRRADALLPPSPSAARSIPAT